MNIKLKKFGTVLTSRQLGKEALAAFLPSLKDISSEEKVYIDFSEVSVFTPSWGDEFLTPLLKKFGNKLILRQTENLSAKASIEILEDSNNLKFVWE